MTHTPGPWIFGGCVVWVENGGIICDCAVPNSNFSPDEIEANTHLIAAAPEMLEALKAAQFELMFEDKDEQNRERVRALIAAAIAKAEGK